MTYDDFLAGKIKVAERFGIIAEAKELHESSKPIETDAILWGLELGRGLLALDCGLGKTHIAIEMLRLLHIRFGGKYLIVTELGASDTFIDKDPAVGEGARLGVNLEYVTCTKDAFKSDCFIVVTNYERVRNNEFDFSKFNGVVLDEGSYLKNMASETTDSLQRELAKIKYKWITTATPSPNETLELINYSHVLGVCDRGQILTRFFQRNSVKAGELTLHPQHADDFWLWVSSWALFVTKPSDLGHSNEGYDLPGLNLIYHEIKLDKAIDGGKDRDGQTKMFRNSSSSLQDAAKIKRSSIDVRIDAAKDIISKSAENHWIIWHHLEDERKSLNEAFKEHKSYGDIFGTQAWPQREKRIVAFSKGDLQILATKPEISGVGCNFQKHSHDAIFLGINYSFEVFYQALCRQYRFGQKFEVNLHILYTPEEYGILKNLQLKWDLHNEQRDKMREIVLKYGLNHSKYIEEKRRSFKQDRKIWTGDNYTLIGNDCVYEFAKIPENSLDMILTSIPFGNHYEYTDKYNDFGHNVTNEEFFKQMDFLLPELLRTLKPGRIAAFHTKNRIHYGSVTGKGFSTFHRFTHAACDCFERNGFECMGFHYIPTDVVAENNQTYRLGYTEMTKDSTKMGSGIPEEIWIFRKRPTSNADAYADDPVTHNKAEYHVSNWQLDADSFWKSCGNRYITPEEIKAWGLDKVQRWWKKFNKEAVYNYEDHVKLLDDLDKARKLSRTFTTTPLQSNSDFIWNDVNRMQGLNMEQSRRKERNHICPMPFDEVDRLIELYSNPGDLIADPFAGLGTSGVRAVKKGRRAFLTELNDVYAASAAYYLKEVEAQRKIPTLFDILQEV